MKTKFDIVKNELVELDISINGLVKSAKYLTISIKHGSNGHIKLLPLKEYMRERGGLNFIVPCIDMPLSMIIGCKKIDRTNLLYLINSGNPHIARAIHSMFGA
jgi:hypothetical protein